MKRFGCFAAGLLAVALLGCCLLGAFLPRKASAVALDVTPWPYDYPTPLPYPTQIAIPTWCATPLVAGEPICGVAAISVAHANGEGGYQLATVAALAFGLAFIGVCVLVGQFVRR
jgi:hypothetical protein